MKSSPLERPKNRYRSFSFWNLSFNDGSRLWRQAPGVTRGQKGANKFSKVSIVPYIYIYLDRFKLATSATGKILAVNLPLRPISPICSSSFSRLRELSTRIGTLLVYNCLLSGRIGRNWCKILFEPLNVSEIISCFLIQIFFEFKDRGKFVLAVKSKIERIESNFEYSCFSRLKIHRLNAT